MRNFNLDEKMYALRAHRAAAGGAPPEPLSSVAGMDALQLNIALKGFFAAVARPLPPPARTNWTRLVPLSVLTGHVSSLFPY